MTSIILDIIYVSFLTILRGLACSLVLFIIWASLHNLFQSFFSSDQSTVGVIVRKSEISEKVADTKCTAHGQKTNLLKSRRRHQNRRKVRFSKESHECLFSSADPSISISSEAAIPTKTKSSSSSRAKSHSTSHSNVKSIVSSWSRTVRPKLPVPRLITNSPTSSSLNSSSSSSSSTSASNRLLKPTLRPISRGIQSFSSSTNQITQKITTEFHQNLNNLTNDIQGSFKAISALETRSSLMKWNGEAKKELMHLTGTARLKKGLKECVKPFSV
ncbi:hypothetical protein K435DRAFT_836657 [Dendrothele bispora CBS 962.96]|uniref:Uncharacterized protein n=1 Tax=Dendrothele bispora (strain CBS 962.96) TaxID=1314807 RepID=A0A4S8MH20_DENBC|nr:hypothetical protein K435DRAFT_836657 [Dendrothele bispora CBS 962.96]